MRPEKGAATLMAPDPYGGRGRTHDNERLLFLLRNAAIAHSRLWHYPDPSRSSGAYAIGES